MGKQKGTGGVGFYIKPNIMRKVLAIKGVSERICYLKLRIDEKTKILIIQIYALTLGSDDTERDQIYNQLDRLVNEKKEFYTIIIDDWNAKVGSRELGRE